MQTKNINVDRIPDADVIQESNVKLPEKNLQRFYTHLVQNGSSVYHTPKKTIVDQPAPPLPPRSALIFTPLPDSAKLQVEVDGYGPYKPVPPPKPLPQLPLASQQSGSFTPPPYRMPPYPLYNEANIPGAAGCDGQLSASHSNSQQGLQTHSSKFPIEREVILSSTDKNSKIPILHDYKKRTKGVVAPDVPPKQMAAWTLSNGQTLSPDQTHPNMAQTCHTSDNTFYRPTYIPSQECYNGQTPTSTGAVPRQTWQGVDPNKPAPRPFAPSEEYTNNNQSVSVQIEPNNKDNNQKETPKSSKGMTKTYHTIKDMISSKFKSSKDQEERNEEVGLNNVTDELRKSQRNLTEEQNEVKRVQEQGNLQKSKIDSMQQQQYNQHLIQQHFLAQQAQHQFQTNNQLKLQQQTMYQQHLAQARSQEMLAGRGDEQLYYQTSYGGSSSNRIMNRPQNFVQMQQQAFNKDGIKDDRTSQLSPDRRSIQQIEREQQVKTFEARRAASQPQLLLDEMKTDLTDSRPQPQAAVSSRRGSYGNLVDMQISPGDPGKESDDGGFLRRNNSRERQLADKNHPMDNSNLDSTGSREKDSLSEVLQGTPRKKLEGEIGKIEGVYNVGQRTKPDDDQKNGKRNTASSGASSDYDKAGGQSSSNVDSGRGSAAYSSGRRQTDINSDIGELARNTYKDISSEWVDVVENELRNILEPKLHELSLHANSSNIANSTISESISSMTPPLPPLSPGEQSSATPTPRNSTRFKHSSLPYGSKPDYEGYQMKSHHRETSGNSRWNGNSSQKNRYTKKMDHNALFRGKPVFGLDNTDITSTTTRSLDLESMLDGQSDSDEDNISTADARTIRKQLEGLESMYSEVLKLLGVKKNVGRYQPSDPRFSKRRYGSMSSLPSSSVSSRPIRDKRKAHEDRKKVRDLRGINKRFQRLESHVVTLARSVAHLSSEMRTQHIMIQEMENIRGEIAALRTQTNMLNVRSQSSSRPTNSSKDLPNLANPTRVKKLTKFFGDEPPLLRMFLRKLGYEKYANVFENERVGMVELPYMSEERLQKMGVPLGPRLRIMQEAQISVCKDNTLCIV
ncbi:uncharacterized protein LOC123309989 isoform X2 [Coccinella septempunctata]|uniref:uncharacterized protein LOC123309989 isoform X2 n=1 Tax=Coccinella septempunctata TaxID=41139 RepID=UPI001D06360B|nr:uncharacterized protein LOC123309989 isoform X2 [Coccinella septempunctata]